MFRELLPWLLPAVLIVGLIVFKMLGQVAKGEVAGLLAEGAVVIDVREPGEFASEHLDVAVNLPLGSLEEKIKTTIPDKNQPVLLHCLSGARSAVAGRKLTSLGYTRVHNLGSISRAREILRESGTH